MHEDPVKVDLVKIGPVKFDQIKQCCKTMSKTNGDNVILVEKPLHGSNLIIGWDPW